MLCTCVCTYTCMCECEYVCVYVCMYVCVYGCGYVCMHGCMHVCMYVREMVWMETFMYASNVSSCQQSNFRYRGEFQHSSEEAKVCRWRRRDGLPDWLPATSWHSAELLPCSLSPYSQNSEGMEGKRGKDLRWGCESLYTRK